MDNSYHYLELFKEGNEAGLKFLISKLGHALRYFAYSMVKSKEVAEEIVSDSFVKLWQRRLDVKSEDNIRAFLYITTKNACYDHLKSPKHKIHWEDIDLSAGDIPSHDDIFSKIVYVELLDLLMRRLDRIPVQQAAVFRMTYLEGLETEEICERLNTTASNVYYARSKAVGMLRKLFARESGSTSTLLGKIALGWSVWFASLF